MQTIKPAEKSAQLFQLLNSIRLIEVEALVQLRRGDVVRPWSHPDEEDEYFELVMQGLATSEPEPGRQDKYRITMLGQTFLAFAEMVLETMGIFLRVDREEPWSRSEMATTAAPSPTARQKPRATLSLVPSSGCATPEASAPTPPR